MYAVMADETKDRQGVENLAVAVRFMPTGSLRPVERCIAVLALVDQTAPAITDKIVMSLNDAGIGTDRLIAQSYDGASVMSGHIAGVNALLSAKLGRTVPYVHCFSHQLHLAVVLTSANSCMFSFGETQLQNTMRDKH